jgi:anti-anti-sigma factor
MEIQRHNGTLTIGGLRELTPANAAEFRKKARAALAPELKSIEIDLSEAGSVDSSGLAALVAVYKMANKLNRNGGVSLRLLDPRPHVQQLIELTRMHHLFEIVVRPRSPDLVGNERPSALVAPDRGSVPAP